MSSVPMSCAPISSVHLLRQMFCYQAWANDELLAKMEALDPAQQPEQRNAALRLMNHNEVVNQIFMAHLVGRAHGFSADNPAETPTLNQLRSSIAATDRWYLQYLETVTQAQLAESTAFRFTDGDKGHMSREEMLAHVVTHGIYHRGEVGRILTQLSIRPPWDTFAAYLHNTESERRSRQ